MDVNMYMCNVPFFINIFVGIFYALLFYIYIFVIIISAMIY